LNGILLDTHILIWWLDGGTRLSTRARRAIENQETTVFVSAASAWEIAIKHQLGKLKARGLLSGFQNEMDTEGFVELPISVKHAIEAGSLPGPHKDPFARMLIAQARTERVPIVSSDALFGDYPVQRIW
jgi:PIN domain nuclease of toxin-antitoxin system